VIYEDPSTPPTLGKSLRTLSVAPGYLSRLYSDLTVEIPTQLPDGLELWPNQPLVLKAGVQSALAVVDPEGQTISRINEELGFFKISGRNKEQQGLLNLLHNPDVRVVVITGPAGTGKSLLVSAWALHMLLEVAEWSRLMLAKPLEITTGTRYWGTVPGDANDKFAPFLRSYNMTFENLVGPHGAQYLQAARDKGKIEFFPLELMRGVSIRDSIVWYDEVQNLNSHEMQTLGSRIDDVGHSKLIVSGDTQQRAKRIDIGDTGLRKLVTSPAFLRSPLTAHVHLTRIERGAVAQLFHDVFG